jgi:isoquinoline 1-oxidoreductase alpha subunit
VDLIINGTTRQVEAEADTPLLWVIRDELGLGGIGSRACPACRPPWSTPSRR